MKTHPSLLSRKLSARIFAQSLLAGWLLAATVLWAGEPPKDGAAEAPRAGAAEARVKKLDLVIKDGEFTNASGQKQKATVENLVDHARAKYHQNIVLSPGVGSVVISDLKLEAADIDGFFKALAVASGMTINAGMVGSHETAVWAVSSRPSDSRRVEVFNLTGYVNPSGKGTAERVEALMTIIMQTFNELKQGHVSPEEEPSFKFHEGANLFVVIGTFDAVNVARQVVGALSGPQAAIPPQERFPQIQRQLQPEERNLLEEGRKQRDASPAPPIPPRPLGPPKP